MIALLPYRLAAEQTPDGFTAFAQTATSNVAVAFASAPEQRSAMLNYLEGSGRMAGVEQQFEPSGAAAPIVRYTVALYATATQALDALAATGLPGGASPSAPFAAPRLGDATLALSSPTAADGSVGPQVVVAWTRARLFFGVVAAGGADDAQDATEAEAIAFASAADGRAATVDAGLPAPPATRDPDEPAQLALANAFASLQLQPDAAPSGFEYVGAYVWSNEQLVLDAAAPEAMVQTLVQDWRRITGEVAFFTATDGSRAVLSSVYEGFADAAGASLALQTPTLGADADDDITSLVPPVALGDESVAFEADVIWPGNEQRRGYTLRWRHGAVLLGVSVNLPHGSAVPAYLAQLATQLDAMYTANTPAP